MISRNPLYVRDILHSEHLCCYPAENQAAKIYAKFLAEHPEYTSKDVDMYIERDQQNTDNYMATNKNRSVGRLTQQAKDMGLNRSQFDEYMKAHGYDQEDYADRLTQFELKGRR